MSGELKLIRAIRSQAGTARGAVRLGIGDDCAVLRPPARHDVLVTTDFSLEGRHFRRDWHPATSAGHRCLARGLSDLAAMGAKPMAAFLSLALPAGMTKTASGGRWVDGFLGGLMALASSTSTPLAGGDTATAPGDAVLADIVLLGSAPRGRELRRSGARAGDALYVTGALGGSAAELSLLQAKPRSFRTARAGDTHPHLYPVPRLAIGSKLRGVATAAIDVSDGLSTDLQHLCDESQLGAVIEADCLPQHPLLHSLAQDESLRLMLHGGEDYELLFTAPAGVRVPRRVGGTAVTRIGEMSDEPGMRLRRNRSEEPLLPAGWEHRI